jgi:hypothetical protein
LALNSDEGREKTKNKPDKKNGGIENANKHNLEEEKQNS